MTFDDPGIQQYLSTKDIVILGTVNPDGAPLVTAMWFLHDPSALTVLGRNRASMTRSSCPGGKSVRAKK